MADISADDLIANAGGAYQYGIVLGASSWNAWIIYSLLTRPPLGGRQGAGRLRPDQRHRHFAEQPVPAGEHEEMAAVRRQIDVPVIADESLYTLADACALDRAGAYDVFSIYVGEAGGIGPARAIAEFALAHGIACTIGSNLELGAGSAAMLHLGLAHRGVTPDAYPCDIIGPFYYEDDILQAPLSLGGGRAAPTDRPGLGVALDEAKVEKHRVR